MAFGASGVAITSFFAPIIPPQPDRAAASARAHRLDRYCFTVLLLIYRVEKPPAGAVAGGRAMLDVDLRRERHDGVHHVVEVTVVVEQVRRYANRRERAAARRREAAQRGRDVV